MRSALDAFLDAAGADLRRLLRDDLWPVVDALRGAQEPRRLPRLPRPALRARDLSATTPTCAPTAGAASPTSSSTSSRTPTRSRRRSCCCSRADDPAETRLARGPAGARQALPGRRPEAVDLPLPPRRRRRSTRREARASSRAAREVVQLRRSFRAVPASRRRSTPPSRRACGERLDASQADVRRRSRRPRPRSRTQPASVALPVPAPYGDYGTADHRAIEESLPDAVAAFVDWLVREERLDGAERERGRASPIQPRHVCLLFRRFQLVRRRRDARPTCARSRRATSRTCWSAARRSTRARRSRRCAPRSPRSSGRTTSCPSSRRCAGRSSPSPTRRCSRSAHAAGAPPVPARCRRRCREPLPRGGRRRSRCSPTCTAGATGGRSPTRSRAARGDPRPRRLRHLADRRAGARQRAARCSTWRAASSAAARTSFRAFVEQLERRGGARRGGRGADRRGGHRGRAHHDRAQGEGARVPGRRSWPIRRASRRRDEPIALRRHRRAACAPMRSPAARRPSCSSTQADEAGARRARRRCGSRTSRRRAPATCWSCRWSATTRRTRAG